MFDEFRRVFGEIDSDYAPTLDEYTDAYHLFNFAVNLIIAVGFMTTLIVIAYSAFLYIVSGGNPDKTKRAWQTFIYGVIAAAITLGAVVLKEIVLRAFGVETTGIDEVSGGYN